MFILIVDDDVLIRKWLTLLLKQIPQRKLSVETAENGVQALENIREHGVPDLVITDIKMPLMDGLELCERLQQELPQLPVVMLSSYEEFSFVKKAMQLGAIDYILKADMSLEDIVSVIEKVEKRQERKQGQSAGGLACAEEKRRLLEEYLRSSLKDDHTFLLRLDPSLSLDTVVLMMFRTDRGINAILDKIFQESISTGVTIIPYAGTVYIAFIRGDRKGTPSMEEKKAVVNGFLQYLHGQETFSVEAWSTLLNCGDVGIYAGIQTCQAVLEFKLYYTLEDFSQTAYRGIGEGGPLTQVPFYKSFFESAGRYQIKDSADFLRKCLDALHEMHCHPSDIKQYMDVMCHKLLSDMSTLELDGDWFNRTLQLLYEIERAPTCGLRRGALDRFLAQYGAVLSQAAPKLSDAVLQAVRYIDDHYAEKITLEQIATRSHMNSTYMSELFKKEMGVALSEYINHVRVLHACEYLRLSNCSMGQIAEFCGFSDQNYFTKVFKKFFHVTPSAYRTQLKE